MIGQLVARNLKIFFRDKSSVFFSMLGVIIIIGLYVLFLGNLMTASLEAIPEIGDDARSLMDSWIMAGVVAAATITTCMGAFGIMIDDKAKHIIKDFRISPVKRSTLLLSYILSTVIVGIIMSLFTLALAEVYIVVYGGKLLSLVAFLETIGLIVLSVACSSSIVFLITSGIKSQNAFGTASTILGTIIGFLTGIYIPIGQLPSTIQVIIKIFPVSHAAALLRQVMMNNIVPSGDIPEYLKTYLGMNFEVDGTIFPVWAHLLVLAASCVVFYLITLILFSRKKSHE